LVYGKCSNPNWHGHNYQLFVTVRGEINPQTGFVVNLKTLSQLIKELVIEKTDHHNLNKDVDFLQNIVPTTENLAFHIWHQLAAPIEALGAELFSIKIEESENNSVEYFG